MGCGVSSAADDTVVTTRERPHSVMRSSGWFGSHTSRSAAVPAAFRELANPQQHCTCTPRHAALIPSYCGIATTAEFRRASLDNQSNLPSSTPPSIKQSLTQSVTNDTEGVPCIVDLRTPTRTILIRNDRPCLTKNLMERTKGLLPPRASQDTMRALERITSDETAPTPATTAVVRDSASEPILFEALVPMFSDGSVDAQITVPASSYFYSPNEPDAFASFYAREV